MKRFTLVVLTSVTLGCGSDPQPPSLPAATAGGEAAVPYRDAAPIVVHQDPHATAPQIVHAPPGRVVIVHAPAPAQPVFAAPPPIPVYAPPPVLAPAPAPAPTTGPATLTCGGQEHVRLTEQKFVNRDGPALVATGDCVVRISESILLGAPAAVVVRDRARVELVECKIKGDIVTEGAAQVRTPGSAHRGTRRQS